MRDGDVDLDTPSDFTASSLSYLDSVLRCPICSELYTAPVILTNCLHTFCSLCLRQHMQLKKTCPQCHAEADESRIKGNSAVAEIVKAWKDARTALLQLQAHAGNATASTSARAMDRTESADAPRRSGRRAGSTAATATVAAQGTRKGKRKLEDDSSDVEIIEEGPVASKKSKGKGKSAVASSTKEDLSDPNLPVICPICTGSFRNVELNMHIDRCDGTKPKKGSHGKPAWDKLLSTQKAGASKSGGGTGAGGSSLKSGDKPYTNGYSTTKPLALTSYSNLKLSTLTNMLKDLGLPTSVLPSATTLPAQLSILKTRHQQFVTLHNANTDIAPEDPLHKSKKELQAELVKWEKLHNAGDKTSDAGGGVATGGMAAVGGGKQYMKKHKIDFEELTRQARASMGSKVQRSNGDPPASDSATPASAIASASVRFKTPSPRSPVTKSSPKSAASLSPTPNQALLDPQYAVPTSAVTNDREVDEEDDDELVRLNLHPIRSSPSNEDEDASIVERNLLKTARKRSMSPFDPSGPRPSQRVRGEEVDLGMESDADMEADMEGEESDAGHKDVAMAEK